MIGVIPAVIAAMATPGVDVTWSITDCGMVNAFYSPDAHSITICSELVDGYPEMVEEVVAHEMSHAIILQLHLPIGNMTPEDAADSLSATFMAKYDPQALIDAGLAFYQLGGDGDGDHSATVDRALYFVCMADGAEDEPANDFCGALFNSTRAYWSEAVDVAEMANEP